jgi:hypothetical protein
MRRTALLALDVHGIGDLESTRHRLVRLLPEQHLSSSQAIKIEPTTQAALVQARERLARRRSCSVRESESQRHSHLCVGVKHVRWGSSRRLRVGMDLELI